MSEFRPAFLIGPSSASAGIRIGLQSLYSHYLLQFPSYIACRLHQNVFHTTMYSESSPSPDWSVTDDNHARWVSFCVLPFLSLLHRILAIGGYRPTYLVMFQLLPILQSFPFFLYHHFRCCVSYSFIQPVFCNYGRVWAASGCIEMLIKWQYRSDDDTVVRLRIALHISQRLKSQLDDSFVSMMILSLYAVWSHSTQYGDCGQGKSRVEWVCIERRVGVAQN